MCLELRYPKFMYFKFIFIIEDFIQFLSMLYNVKNIFCRGLTGCLFVLLLVMVGGFFVVFFFLNFLFLIWVV